MKAKKESHSTPSSECLQLMNWNIFITTIEDESFTFKKIYLL
jgi:hypothetical protein